MHNGTREMINCPVKILTPATLIYPAYNPGQKYLGGNFVEHMQKVLYEEILYGVGLVIVKAFLQRFFRG
jgi:hypothetical protein